MKNICFAVMAAAIVFTSPGFAQSSGSAETMQMQRDLDAAFKPLHTLNERQMAAVAGLIRANQFGIDITDYCPPLRKFHFPKPMPCFDQMVSFASASRECKKARPNWKECPQFLEAEAAWSSCEFANFRVLRGELGALGLIGK